MIISPGRNYIFVHIPKTGGTSLALALEARAKKDDILIGDTPKARKRRHRLQGVEARGRLWKHSSLADIEGLVTPDFISQAFCVTLVRNPWDRLVSLYHWLQRQTFDHPSVHLARTLEFTDYLSHPAIQRMIRANPYTGYMTGPDGRDRAGAYIRLEFFESDATPFWQYLGFRLELPHVNHSRRPRDYRACYCSQSAELVARLCASDIARFGYRFG